MQSGGRAAAAHFRVCYRGGEEGGAWKDRKDFTMGL